MEIPRISPQQAMERIDLGERVLFLDSRSPHAWAESRRQIAGSIRVPPNDVDSHLAHVTRGPMVVSYCT